MKQEDYPIMLNASEVAQIMRVSDRRAYEIMDLKDFPLRRIGRRKFVHRDAFFKWLEGGQVAQ